MSASQATKDTMARILAAHDGLEGPLLPILHAVQAEMGFIPEDVQPIIANHLNISKAEVHGVVTFYHDFRDAPAGRHIVKICRAEACQAMGANGLAEATLAKLGVDWHGTTANGAVTVEPARSSRRTSRRFATCRCVCAPKRESRSCSRSAAK